MIKLNTGAPLSDNLIFEVTQRCNGNCKYCYNVWKLDPQYPRGELHLWKLKGLIKKAVKESKAHIITLTGGEPLLRKDLEGIVELIRKLGVYANLITNATLLNEARIKRLICSGVSIFEVPLLSDKRGVHNSLMRMDSFDSVTEAIVKIKKHKGKVVSVFVATKENIGDFEGAARLSYALGVDGIMFNRFNPGGEGAKYINELLPTPEQIRQALKSADDFSGKYNIGISCSIPIQPCIIDTTEFQRLGFGFCSAGSARSYYTIDPLGNFRMCNHSRIILGNLFRESFKELISKEGACDFISAMPSRCLKCRLGKSCLGGCKASAEVCFGSACEEEPFLRFNKDKRAPAAQEAASGCL